MEYLELVGHGYVRVGRAKSLQNMDGELIKVNRDIHEGEGVNIAFDVLHIIGNSLITLFRTGKILAMGHDPTTRMRGIHLFESSLSRTRCGGGRDELH